MQGLFVKRVVPSMVIGLGPFFFRLDFSGRVIARLPPAPCRKEWRRIEEIGCSVGFMQNCPADLHLAGFCGISADCAESGLDSPNFAFSQNSSVAQFEHFLGLQLSPSVFSLPIKNVPIIGSSTNADISSDEDEVHYIP